MAVAPVAAATGIGLVRFGWHGPRPAAIAGWALVAAGLVTLTVLAGAWGIAVTSVVAILAALAILLREGWRTPRGRAAPLRAPPSFTLPRPTLSGVARRVAVFALVVPVAAAATALFAFGLQAATRRAGWAEADSTVVMLMAQPLGWTVLASVQMTRTGPAAMIAPTLACAIAGLLLW